MEDDVVESDKVEVHVVEGDEVEGLGCMLVTRRSNLE